MSSRYLLGLIQAWCDYKTPIIINYLKNEESGQIINQTTAYKLEWAFYSQFGNQNAITS